MGHSKANLARKFTTFMKAFCSLVSSILSINIFCMRWRLEKWISFGKNHSNLDFLEEKMKTINSHKNNHKFSLNRKTNHRRFVSSARGETTVKVKVVRGRLNFSSWNMEILTRGKFMILLNYFRACKLRFYEVTIKVLKAWIIWRELVNLK